MFEVDWKNTTSAELPRRSWDGSAVPATTPLIAYSLAPQLLDELDAVWGVRGPHFLDG